MTHHSSFCQTLNEPWILKKKKAYEELKFSFRIHRDTNFIWRFEIILFIFSFCLAKETIAGANHWMFPSYFWTACFEIPKHDGQKYACPATVFRNFCRVDIFRNVCGRGGHQLKLGDVQLIIMDALTTLSFQNHMMVYTAVFLIYSVHLQDKYR